MLLKQYIRYQIDFKGKWIQPSAMFMGLSFFLRIFYFFGFRFVSDWSFWDILFQIGLPLVASGVYTVVFWTLKRNSPGLYALLGALLCLLLFVWNIYTGNIIYIAMSLVYYLVTALILLLTTGGFLPGKLLASVLLILPVITRLLWLKPFALGIDGLCLEFSVLFMLASLFCLTRSFKEIPICK